MNLEREHNNSGRLPETVGEQLRLLPDAKIREEICHSLAIGITSLLVSNGVRIEEMSVRTKSVDRINEKIKRRGSMAPMRDIYGIRIITEDTDRKRLKDLIQSAYPATPEVFPNGMPSSREYADSKIREFVQKNYNPKISDQHSALHVNIVFLREGECVFDIAEIQVMTAKELEIYKSTRESYVNGRNP